MNFKKIFEIDNLQEDVNEAELVLLLQFGIDVRDIKSKIDKGDPVGDLISECDKLLDELIMSRTIFSASHYKDTKVIQQSSLLSVYTTVCALLDGKKTRCLDTIRREFAGADDNKNKNDNENDKKKEMKQNTGEKADNNKDKKIKISKVNNYKEGELPGNIRNSSHNCRMSTKLWESTESYLYNAITPMTDENVSENKKQLYKFGSHSLMLMMWKQKQFKVVDGIGIKTRPLTPSRLKKTVNNYMNIYKQIESAIGTKGEHVLYRSRKAGYINDFAVLETITNVKLLNAILTILCYLVYKGHDLTGFIMDTLLHAIELPGVLNRDFWLYVLIESIADKEKFSYLGLQYTKYFEKNDSIGELLISEGENYARQYVSWQMNFRKVLILISDLVLPVYDSTLFVLLYRYCYLYSISSQDTLRLMKSIIETHLSVAGDSIIDDYGIYIDDADDAQVLRYDRITEMWSNGAISKNGKYHKVSWSELFDKINWNKNKSNYQMLEEFVFRFFDKMKQYQTGKNRSCTYGVTRDSFSFRRLKKAYPKPEDGKNASREYFHYLKPWLNNIIQYNISAYEKLNYK